MTSARERAEATPRSADQGGLAWFFGYGSLMWHPGFVHEAFEPARLDGFHRALCIYSHHYRGTPARPGLVLGLAPGGACTGRAIGVAAAREPEVLAYLDARELLTSYVYERRLLPLELLGGGRQVRAWCYVARSDHEQFAGGLDQAAMLGHVLHGHGAGGSNIAYVRNTVAHLREIGIREPELERLAEQLPPEPD
ncbi:gamma-glutamylcyclotransferase (plasmid) [Geminicoccaceae bacterium 1502E]|nr:gamma-glutamylcyclotransferase [Geminicoccaceae bacterium 1502E]